MELTIYKGTIDRRRELVKIPSVVGSLGPAERAVLVASTERPVVEYTGTELATELNTALKWIAKDIGCREGDETDKQYLVIRVAEILKRYYQTFTLKDFRLAFEMCITGELDEYLPKDRDGQADRNHYQQFNAEYICKVLRAYRLRRGAILRKANEAAPKKAPIRDTSKDADNANAVKKQCIDAFLFFKYRGHMPQMSVVNEIVCYDALVAAGLADELTMTGDDQKMVLRGEFARLAKREVREPKYESFARKRRKALRDAFTWMAENEIQLTDYLKIA